MLRRRRLFRPNPLGPDLMTTLIQANQLQAEGKPLEAARLFAQLATAMQARQHPHRAANLYTRAAHAYADARDAEHALACARQALQLFAQTRMARRAAAFHANITRKMTGLGMTAAASDLEREFGAQIAALPAEPQPATPLRHDLLPTHCPKCGAPVHTEDATWVDDRTLECEYCGAYIRSES
jgi:hypothetical protein